MLPYLLFLCLTLAGECKKLPSRMTGTSTTTRLSAVLATLLLPFQHTVATRDQFSFRFWHSQTVVAVAAAVAVAAVVVVTSSSPSGPSLN